MIDNKHSNPPKQRVRLRDIALRANTSVGTVSMALNDRVELSESTRTKIKQIATELGYVPNRIAKSLSLGRTGIIGVVMPFAIDPYYAAILDALHTEAEKREYEIQFQFHRWAVDAEERAVRRLAESRVDGVLLYAARESYLGTPFFEWLEATKTPLVSLSRWGGDLPSLAGQIVKNYDEEAILAGEELIRLGHRSIDVLPFQVKGNADLARYQALFELAKQHPGVRIRPFFCDQFEADESIDFIRQHGLVPERFNAVLQRAAAAYAAWPERGTAVVVSSNQIAWRLMTALQRVGKYCPNDISIISTGILGNGADSGFPLSATEYDPTEIARLALDALIRRIETGECLKELRVTPKLYLRDSTAPISPERSAHLSEPALPSLSSQ